MCDFGTKIGLNSTNGAIWPALDQNDRNIKKILRNEKNINGEKNINMYTVSGIKAFSRYTGIPGKCKKRKS